jgi:HAE1 family hydrophobic/amphiphilic exporter-1
MNISAPFIARPIATALLMVGLLLGGLTAYPLLPADPAPTMT